MTKIALIGGGIGGLTAALTLRQFGFEPEVFEQAPELLEVGAAIAVWPNAMRILDRLGIGQEIIRHAGIIEQVSWLDSDGRPRNSVRLSTKGPPAVALQRADLQGVLLHALPSAAIHLGKVFQNLDQQKNFVRASFADGSTIDCDLLIGCDGLHSQVRARLLADLPPVLRGYTVWRGTTTVAPRALDPATAIELHGRGQRFGIGPVGLNRIGWWASANQTLIESAQVNRGAGLGVSAGPASGDNRHELLALFAGWYAPVLELIEGTLASSIVRTAVSDRPATRKWGRGRVTLLGDAVHPTTPNLGQGGCLAIEDALIIARCLHQYGPGEGGLRAYERLRYARTRAVSGYSRIYGSIGQWEGPWATRLRGAALSLVPELITRRLLGLIFNYDADGLSI